MKDIIVKYNSEADTNATAGNIEAGDQNTQL